MPATDEDLTMNASREMPKYECRKKVWALKIAGDGAAELGKLLREQHRITGPVPHA